MQPRQGAAPPHTAAVSPQCSPNLTTTSLQLSLTVVQPQLTPHCSCLSPRRSPTLTTSLQLPLMAMQGCCSATQA